MHTDETNLGSLTNPAVVPNADFNQLHELGRKSEQLKHLELWSTHKRVVPICRGSPTMQVGMSEFPNKCIANSKSTGNCSHDLAELIKWTIRIQRIEQHDALSTS